MYRSDESRQLHFALPRPPWLNSSPEQGESYGVAREAPAFVHDHGLNGQATTDDTDATDGKNLNPCYQSFPWLSPGFAALAGLISLCVPQRAPWLIVSSSRHRQRMGKYCKSAVISLQTIFFPIRSAEWSNLCPRDASAGYWTSRHPQFVDWCLLPIRDCSIPIT